MQVLVRKRVMLFAKGRDALLIIMAVPLCFPFRARRSFHTALGSCQPHAYFWALLCTVYTDTGFHLRYSLLATITDGTTILFLLFILLSNHYGSSPNQRQPINHIPHQSSCQASSHHPLDACIWKPALQNRLYVLPCVPLSASRPSSLITLQLDVQECMSNRPPLQMALGRLLQGRTS